MEENRVFELLAGFNPKFEQICIQLPICDTFPSLFKVYSHLHKEERCRSTMMQPAMVERPVMAMLSSVIRMAHGPCLFR